MAFVRTVTDAAITEAHLIRPFSYAHFSVFTDKMLYLSAECALGVMKIE